MKFAGPKAKAACQSPNPSIWAFLIFGEDEGVCADLTRQLQKAWESTGPLEAVRLSEDEIRKDPASFHDALEARSLLGEARLLRVRTSGDKIASILLDAMAHGETADRPPETRLIIESGPLKPRSKLRAGFEAAKRAAALHIFADEVGDVSQLVTTALVAHGLEIEPDALDEFIAELPGHRGLANSEIEKLCLYGLGLGRALHLSDIRAISATETEHGLTDLVTSVFSGDLHRSVQVLDRLLIAGSSPITLIRAFQRETLRLLSARGMAGQGGDIGMKLRPPVFKSAWPAFRERMQLWPARRLVRVMERLHDAEADAKAAGALAEPELRELTLNLAKAAAASRSAGRKG